MSYYSQLTTHNSQLTIDNSLGNIIVGQKVCKIFPAPVALVDPVFLIIEITILFDYDGINQIDVRNFCPHIFWKLKPLYILGFRFLLITDADLSRIIYLRFIGAIIDCVICTVVRVLNNIEFCLIVFIKQADFITIFSQGAVVVRTHKLKFGSIINFFAVLTPGLLILETSLHLSEKTITPIGTYLRFI